MFATSADILNMSLAIGFIVLVIFLSILVFYGILILRDISKVTDDVKDVTERVRVSVVAPLKALGFIMTKIQPYIEMVLEKKMKKKK